MLLSNKQSWGWRSKMSEFMVVCFYVYTRWRIPFSISMSIVPPKAMGAIILSFIISEALPILLYLSWSNGNGNTPTNMSHLACLKSSMPIESCNPSVIEYRFQQLHGMNQVLSVISLLQLFYQGLSIEHFNSTWACLKLSKSKPVYKLSILCHIFTLCQFITTQVIQHSYMELILILPFSWGLQWWWHWWYGLYGTYQSDVKTHTNMSHFAYLKSLPIKSCNPSIKHTHMK